MTPEQAANNYHWIKYNPETFTIELFMDHHMLSTLRTCESKFVLEHILNARPKGHNAWSLVFGAWMHYCFEVYYEHSRKTEGDPPEINSWLNYAKDKWATLKLDKYKDEDKYIDIGGWPGACSLLVQYYTFYRQLRMRVVAVEIPFGFDREVPLGQFQIYLTKPRKTDNGNILLPIAITVKCYLTGRLDLEVDNGSVIGPVDHKHTHIFRGDEWDKFNPHDGITGYIYATDKIMYRFFPEFKKSCRTGWIFHIQGKSPAVNKVTKELRPRFKASRIDKTESQLKDYAIRQLSTFKRVTELLLQDKESEWTTTACHNIYNRPCEYLTIHKQPREEWAAQMQQFYNITTPWNPNKPEESLIERDDVIHEATYQEVVQQAKETPRKPEEVL